MHEIFSNHDVLSYISEYLVGKNTSMRFMHKVLFIFIKNKVFTKILCMRFKMFHPIKSKKYHNIIQKGFIELTKGSTRKKMYEEAIKLGYIWFTENKIAYRCKGGYDFQDKIEKYAKEHFSSLKDTIFLYKDLIKMKIQDDESFPDSDEFIDYNYKLFVLVEDNENKMLRTYKLKFPDVYYKHASLTSYTNSLKFIKLF